MPNNHPNGHGKTAEISPYSDFKVVNTGYEANSFNKPDKTGFRKIGPKSDLELALKDHVDYPISSEERRFFNNNWLPAINKGVAEENQAEYAQKALILYSEIVSQVPTGTDYKTILPDTKINTIDVPSFLYPVESTKLKKCHTLYDAIEKVR